MMILLLGAQGCASAYRTIAKSDELSDNPRDYFDPGDKARLTLHGGAQIVGEVTRLRTDSITLDDTEVQWSEVIRAELDQSDRLEILRAAEIAVMVAGFAWATYIFWGWRFL
jgi:hypothetical protein